MACFAARMCCTLSTEIDGSAAAAANTGTCKLTMQPKSHALNVCALDATNWDEQLSPRWKDCLPEKRMNPMRTATVWEVAYLRFAQVAEIRAVHCGTKFEAFN